MEEIDCYGCGIKLFDIEKFRIDMSEPDICYNRPEFILTCENCGNLIQKMFEQKRGPVQFWGGHPSPGFFGDTEAHLQQAKKNHEAKEKAIREMVERIGHKYIDPKKEALDQSFNELLKESGLL